LVRQKSSMHVIHRVHDGQADAKTLFSVPFSVPLPVSLGLGFLFASVYGLELLMQTGSSQRAPYRFRIEREAVCWPPALLNSIVVVSAVACAVGCPRVCCGAQVL
jgi:hypothetical protein